MSVKLLDPHMWSLETLLKNIYKVPVYQRPYSWGKEQIDTLLSDIFKSYNSIEREGYYTGNIIVYDRNEKVEGQIQKFDIIDGQQRIASFALIMIAIYSIACNLGVEENDKGLYNIKDSLWKTVERKYRKDLKTVELNSIDKDSFQYIYDSCFDNPKNILEMAKKYDIKSEYDKVIINNFENIYKTILNNLNQKNADEILNFAEYILQFIKFIIIEAHCKENEVFSMFESINSKGKQLETIDLIKTYIFSKIDEESCDKYLTIWGNLIIKTGDRLYDYLYNYIKAYLSYYRQNININNFKSLSNKELLIHFNVTDESTALKKLLDDLESKVDFYNMLYSTEDAYNLIKSSKFRFYFEIFIRLGYQHPKALFLRTFIEFNDGILSKKDAKDIFIETIIFMMKFITICDRSSKDAITTFSNILNNTYDKVIDKDIVIYYLQNELRARGVTNEFVKNNLKILDCYKQKREISVPLIALYESISKNGKNISYDQAYNIVKNFKDIFSLDHLLAQTPKIDDDNYKYYCDEENNTLILKKESDFPENIINGMDYEIFKQSILNKIGNLRIYYRDMNSVRGNEAISLPKYENFNSYKDIIKRENDIVNMVIDFGLAHTKINTEKINKIINSKNNKKELYKMDKIIELGILKPGDDIYITVKPDESIATLIDNKYVNYKGEKMTLNEWGRNITGWKSIRIYQYIAKVGEEETIQAIREKISNDL